MLLLLQHSQGWLAKRRHVISRSADGYLYVLIGAVISTTWERGGYVFFQHIVAAFAIERVSYWVLKNGLRRRRPSDALPEFESQITAADEFSFPSGHTSAACLVVTLLVLHVGPRRLPLYIWSMAVAMSRVYLGVHFPTDTVMGAVLGTSVALSTAYWLF